MFVPAIPATNAAAMARPRSLRSARSHSKKIRCGPNSPWYQTRAGSGGVATHPAMLLRRSARADTRAFRKRVFMLLCVSSRLYQKVGIHSAVVRLLHLASEPGAATPREPHLQ